MTKQPQHSRIRSKMTMVARAYAQDKIQIYQGLPTKLDLVDDTFEDLVRCTMSSNIVRD
jgi:hypothetical protein